MADTRFQRLDAIQQNTIDVNWLINAELDAWNGFAPGSQTFEMFMIRIASMFKANCHIHPRFTTDATASDAAILSANQFASILYSNENAALVADTREKAAKIPLKSVFQTDLELEQLDDGTMAEKSRAPDGLFAQWPRLQTKQNQRRFVLLSIRVPSRFSQSDPEYTSSIDEQNIFWVLIETISVPQLPTSYMLHIFSALDEDDAYRTQMTDEIRSRCTNMIRTHARSANVVVETHAFQNNTQTSNVPRCTEGFIYMWFRVCWLDTHEQAINRMIVDEIKQFVCFCFYKLCINIVDLVSIDACIQIHQWMFLFFSPDSIMRTFKFGEDDAGRDEEEKDEEEEGAPSCFDMRIRSALLFLVNASAYDGDFLLPVRKAITGIEPETKLFSFAPFFSINYQPNRVTKMVEASDGQSIVVNSLQFIGELNEVKLIQSLSNHAREQTTTNIAVYWAYMAAMLVSFGAAYNRHRATNKEYLVQHRYCMLDRTYYYKTNDDRRVIKQNLTFAYKILNFANSRCAVRTHKKDVYVDENKKIRIRKRSLREQSFAIHNYYTRLFDDNAPGAADSAGSNEWLPFDPDVHINNYIGHDVMQVPARHSVFLTPTASSEWWEGMNAHVDQGFVRIPNDADDRLVRVWNWLGICDASLLVDQSADDTRVSNPYAYKPIHHLSLSQFNIPMQTHFGPHTIDGTKTINEWHHMLDTRRIVMQERSFLNETQCTIRDRLMGADNAGATGLGGLRHAIKLITGPTRENSNDPTTSTANNTKACRLLNVQWDDVQWITYWMRWLRTHDTMHRTEVRWMPRWYTQGCTNRMWAQQLFLGNQHPSLVPWMAWGFDMAPIDTPASSPLNMSHVSDAFIIQLCQRLKHLVCRPHAIFHGIQLTSSDHMHHATLSDDIIQIPYIWNMSAIDYTLVDVFTEQAHAFSLVAFQCMMLAGSWQLTQSHVPIHEYVESHAHEWLFKLTCGMQHIFTRASDCPSLKKKLRFYAMTPNEVAYFKQHVMIQQKNNGNNSADGMTAMNDFIRETAYQQLWDSNVWSVWDDQFQTTWCILKMAVEKIDFHTYVSHRLMRPFNRRLCMMIQPMCKYEQPFQLFMPFASLHLDPNNYSTEDDILMFNHITRFVRNMSSWATIVDAKRDSYHAQVMWKKIAGVETSRKKLQLYQSCGPFEDGFRVVYLFSNMQNTAYPFGPFWPSVADNTGGVADDILVCNDANTFASARYNVLQKWHIFHTTVHHPTLRQYGSLQSALQSENDIYAATSPVYTLQEQPVEPIVSIFKMASANVDWPLQYTQDSIHHFIRYNNLPNATKTDCYANCALLTCIFLPGKNYLCAWMERVLRGAQRIHSFNHATDNFKQAVVQVELLLLVIYATRQYLITQNVNTEIKMLFFLQHMWKIQFATGFYENSQSKIEVFHGLPLSFQGVVSGFDAENKPLEEKVKHMNPRLISLFTTAAENAEGIWDGTWVGNVRPNNRFIFNSLATRLKMGMCEAQGDSNVCIDRVLSSVDHLIETISAFAPSAKDEFEAPTTLVYHRILRCRNNECTFNFDLSIRYDGTDANDKYALFKDAKHYVQHTQSFVLVPTIYGASSNLQHDLNVNDVVGECDVQPSIAFKNETCPDCGRNAAWYRQHSSDRMLDVGEEDIMYSPFVTETRLHKTGDIIMFQAACRNETNTDNQFADAYQWNVFDEILDVVASKNVNEKKVFLSIPTVGAMHEIVPFRLMSIVYKVGAPGQDSSGHFIILVRDVQSIDSPHSRWLLFNDLNPKQDVRSFASKSQAETYIRTYCTMQHAPRAIMPNYATYAR